MFFHGFFEARGLMRIILLFMTSLASALPALSAPTMEQVLNPPFFDASDIREVRRGGFGVSKVHEVSDREIAVVIACLVRVPSEEALAPFLGEGA